MITSPHMQRNPYIIGRPIDDEKLLIGREELFALIKKNLQDRQRVILLHGQRRIGKSSIISNIPKKSQDLDDFVFVSFDLEDYSQEPLSRILAALAQRIVEDINLEEDNITLPEGAELEVNPYIFYQQFLPQIYQKLEGKKLVLLFDEFDALSNKNPESLLETLFKYLSAIINLDDKLYLILFIGQELLETQNIGQIFNNVLSEEIGLLDKRNTENLITKPAQNILFYEEDAIEAIFKLSAGHPYFTQVICFAIFVRAREKEAFKVSKEDVEAVTDKAIELGEASLAWFWDGFSIPEKVLFSAVAEAQENAGNPLELLKSYGVDEQENWINKAREQLKNGFLDDTGQKIKIELVRRWIIQRHPLREEISELDKIEQKKNHSKGEITIHSNNNVNDSQVLSTTPNIAENNSPKLPLTIFNIIDIFRNNSTTSKLFILTALLQTLAITSSIIILVLGGYQFFRTCPAGQQKDLGFLCVEDNSSISRGDRTLFPNITNLFRDQGIAAFKQGNYQKAAELFDKAVTANRSDPEVLIYANNARARQQGSPLTLAVVVPVVDNRTGNAQEILRGVAQAQNQFNKNPRFGGRLLEIVIANDSNDPDQAKQVAQELIKDQSILAVIGHNASGITQAALSEYEKAQLAVISPTSSSIFLQNPIFFRTVVSDEAAGKKLAEYTYKNLKFKKVVIFANPISLYSDGIREKFTKDFEKLGGEVVRSPMIDLTATTFDADKEVPRSLYRYGAEAAMLFPDVKYTEVAINIAKANEQLKNSPTNPQRRALKLLGGSSLYSEEILRRGGKAVEGLILSVPWFREAPQAQEFAKQAQQLWGGGISWRTATSYDATKALIKALSSNASRTTVLENLQNVTLSSSETSGDGLQFTPERERQGEPILVQIKGGKFVLLNSSSLKSP